MAVSWIKVEGVTPEKPEVFQISVILRLDPEKVFAKLFKVWRWVDQIAVKGNAKGVSLETVDYIAGHEGFGKAMEKVGWCLGLPEGLVFPNADRHLGEGAKQRGLTAKRVDKHQKNNEGSNGSCVTNQTQELTQEPLAEKRREEKNKEEEKTKKVSTADQQPDTTEDLEPGPGEAKKPNFAWSADAEELAWYWKSLLRRAITNPDIDVGHTFDEWMRQGISKERILAEIKNQSRLRTEAIWDLQKRIFPKNNGPPGESPGSKAETARKIRRDLILGKEREK